MAKCQKCVQLCEVATLSFCLLLFISHALASFMIVGSVKKLACLKTEKMQRQAWIETS